MDDAILAGIRVIDMSSGIAGPVAAMQLAEAGADVIKVEPPEGDPQRGTPAFAIHNRSKRSVVLDERADAEQLDRLLGSADILIHSFTPREAKARNIDDAALAKRFPRLIVGGLTGWPQGHPNENVPVRDTLVLAQSGYFDEQQPQARDSGPTYLRLPAGSWLSTHLLLAGVLARLIHRERGGRGGAANTSLVQGALLSSGQFQWQRAEHSSPGLSNLPKDLLTSIFECADGIWIHIMGSVDHTPLVGRELERLGPREVERINAEEQGTRWNMFPNWGAVKRILKTRPHQEWVEDMRACDVAVQPVVPMGEIYFDEQAIANHYVTPVADPVWGATRQPGTPFTTTPQSRVKGGAPVLGAHTREVLAKLEPVSPVAAPPPPGDDLPPLHGLKVLDMGGALAGPLGPMLLAQLGAEVVKLEAVEGDRMRWIENAFAGCQRGKRSIAVQLKDPASRPIVERLAAWADVVHHNMRIPATKRLGIDYETLKPLNDKMIYCHVSGYGPKGPRKDWPGMDQMYQSSCGWEYEAAGAGNPPMWHRSALTDHLAALVSTEAVLLALYHRERTGQGQQVFSSLLGATLLTVENLVDSDGRLTPLPKLDHLQYGVSPFERLYPCSDGWLALSEPDPLKQHGILAAAGIASPAALAGVISARTVAENLRGFEAANAGIVPVGMNQCDAFFDSKANQAIKLVVTRNHAVYGKFEEVGALWHMGDLSLSLERPAPALGEHSREVLSDMQFSSAEIDGLIRSNTVFAPETPMAVHSKTERVRSRAAVPAPAGA